MKRLSLINPVLILIFFIACDTKDLEPNDESMNFDSFEMSYYRSNTILVDSSGAFIIPIAVDTVGVGLLPDSILRQVNHVAKLLLDSTTQSTEKECYDCPSVAIVLTKGNETRRVKQLLNIHPDIDALTDAMRALFVEKKISQFSMPISETYRMLVPPPPPPPGLKLSE